MKCDLEVEREVCSVRHPRWNIHSLIHNNNKYKIILHTFTHNYWYNCIETVIYLDIILSLVMVMIMTIVIVMVMIMTICYGYGYGIDHGNEYSNGLVMNMVMAIVIVMVLAIVIFMVMAIIIDDCGIVVIAMVLIMTICYSYCYRLWFWY